jgi:DUF4097 and DUF4098 domain-containing protein YvlB
MAYFSQLFTGGLVKVGMKPNYLLFLICLVPVAAPAQSGLVDNQERTLRCEDRNQDSGRVERCEVHEQTLASTGSLRVNAGANGGVHVKGWSQPGVLVRYKVEAWSNSLADAQAVFSGVQVHAVAGDVAATGPVTEGNRGWSVSYEVFVPHQTGLDLQATNGGVHVSDVAGTMNLQTVNGGLHLARVNGAVTAATVNGGVHVDLIGDRWEGRGLEATSTNGGIHLSVPRSYSAQFAGTTVNGRIKSDFAELSVPAEMAHANMQSINGALGGGGAAIRAMTTNGSLVIERQ